MRKPGLEVLQALNTLQSFYRSMRSEASCDYTCWNYFKYFLKMYSGMPRLACITLIMQAFQLYLSVENKTAMSEAILTIMTHWAFTDVMRMWFLDFFEADIGTLRLHNNSLLLREDGELLACTTLEQMAQKKRDYLLSHECCTQLCVAWQHHSTRM